MGFLSRQKIGEEQWKRGGEHYKQSEVAYSNIRAVTYSGIFMSFRNGGVMSEERVTRGEIGHIDRATIRSILYHSLYYT